jgi:trans-aconitate methyltransferase
MEPNQTWDAKLYEDRHGFVWQHGASLIELLAPQPGERVLDLGCGTGRLTARLAETGAAVVGIDSSEEMLAQARSAYPHLDFVRADARAFAFAEPFDAVFSNAVLHWIKEPERIVRRVRNSLRPGGRFVAEFGGRGNVRAITDALRIAGAGVGMTLDMPLWYFPSVPEYATLLEAAGLEVTFAALFHRRTPLEGASGLRDWVRMFARSALDIIPADRQEEFLAAVEDAARPALFRDGSWSADYRRLRVVAARHAGS